MSMSDTLKLIQQLMADMEYEGDDKGSDVIPTRFDVNNAPKPTGRKNNQDYNLAKGKQQAEADMVQNTRGTLYEEGMFAPENPTSFKEAKESKREKDRADNFARAKQAAEADMVQNTRGTLYEEGMFAPENPTSFKEAVEARLKEKGEDDTEEKAEQLMRDMSPTVDVAEEIQEAVEAAAEEPAGPPKAKAVYTPEQAQELFKVTHGEPFDPKAPADKKKMKEIEETLVEQGGLGDQTANQFALNIYRKYKYV